MARTLCEMASDWLNSNSARATALALAPLAMSAPAGARPDNAADLTTQSQAAGYGGTFTIDSVQIGEVYGGQFQDGTQFSWTDSEFGGPPATGVEACLTLGPILGANPFLMDPPPEEPPQNLNGRFQFYGSINRPIPAGSVLRISYRFTAIFTGGVVDAYSLYFDASSYDTESKGSDYVSGFGISPEFLTSGQAVTGMFETTAFTINGDYGYFFFQMFFGWNQFAPTDQFSVDWCGPDDYLRIELIESVAPPCFGDANGDGVVNFADVTNVLAFFNFDYTPGTGMGDANRNGVVNFADVTNVLSNFGLVCP
jgi:hypothetical protein